MALVDEFEVVVLGGGLAGLTAGLFSVRCGRSTLVLVPAGPGGQLLNIPRIEDFPGFPEGVAGYDLGPLVQEQAAAYGAQFQMAAVERLVPDEGAWRVGTSDADVRADAVIVATGSRPRVLGIPGEEQLRGKGVSQCASCDAPLFRDRTVGVVGGGDSALQEALELANHVGEVIILHRGETFRAHATYQRRVFEHPRITVRCGTVVEEILGESMVAGVRTRRLTTGETVDVELAAVFIYIGQQPQTVFLRDVLELDERGSIPTDIWLRTELAGVFAAGDVRRDSAGQAVAGAGDGATAALAAHRYLDDRWWPAVSAPSVAGAHTMRSAATECDRDPPEGSGPTSSHTAGSAPAGRVQ